jgi:hypothetical protein
MDNNNNEIIVYDDYKINLYKYPRSNTEKEHTDIIIIIFLMHEDFLKKLAISFEDSMKYYHQCKEYYYIFNFNKIIKKYSAQEIILLMKNTNDYLRDNFKVENQMKYLNNMLLIDQIFYFYIRNKDFYINLYDALEDAKRAYFERRDFSYRIIPPNDFYTGITPKIYNAIELMEIYSYTNYLVGKKIIKDLPLPKYLDVR